MGFRLALFNLEMYHKLKYVFENKMLKRAFKFGTDKRKIN
jgi:hypothetical protein